MAEHSGPAPDKTRAASRSAAPTNEGATVEDEVRLETLSGAPGADGATGDTEGRLASLVADPRLAGSPRARLLSQLQRGYGNHYTARIASRALVQRAPAPPDTRKNSPSAGGSAGGPGVAPPGSAGPPGTGSNSDSSGGVPVPAPPHNASTSTAPAPGPAPAAAGGAAVGVEYVAYVAAADQAKAQLVTAATERKQRVTTAADTEKTSVRTALEADVKRLGDLYDAGIKRTQDVTERLRGQVTAARDEQLAAIRTNADTELGNLDAIVQAYQATIRGVAAQKSKEATDGGESQATRGTSGSQQRADQAQAFGQQKVAEFAGMPQGAEVSAAVQSRLPQLIESFRKTGEEVAAMARRDSASMAAHFAEEGEKLATGDMAKQLTKGRERIGELRDEAIKDVNKLAQDALKELDKQSSSLLNDLRAGKDRDTQAIRQTLPLAIDDITSGAKAAQDKIDEQTKQAATDVDRFTGELSKASPDGPFVDEAKAGLAQAVQQHGADLDTFTNSAVAAFPTGTTQARSQSGAMVDKVGGSIDKVVDYFENGGNELLAKLKEKAGEVAKKSLSAMRDVTREAMDNLRDAVSTATEKWSSQVEDGLRRIANKVDIALAKEDFALAQFKTSIEAKANELAAKSRTSVVSAVGEALLAAVKFLVGVVVGFFEAAWLAIKAIWEFIKTPLFWTLLAIAAVLLIAAILIFGWAEVLAALKLILEVIVVVGIVAGIGFAIYYIYLAITKPGLSAYERGKLFGRAIFEIVLAFAGTGVWARMGRFFAEIGQIAKLIDRIGNAARAARLFSRVRNLELLVSLLEKVEDSEKLLVMLDKVGDGEKLLALLNKVGDAELTFKLLDKVSDADKLTALLDRAKKAETLLALLEKVPDADKLLQLLQKVPDTGQLLALLQKVPKAETLLSLLEKVPDVKKLLALLEKVPNGETLVKLLEKVSNPDQLLTLLTQVKDPDKLLKIVEKVNDFGKLQRLLGKVRDPDKLLQLLEKVPDPDKLLELLNLIEAVTGTADADKALQALSQVSDIDLLLLSIDPANKANLITPKGLAEGRIGLDLKNSRLPGLKRDPTGAAEFIDGAGVHWDIKGFNSARPAAQGGFDLARDADKIATSIGEGENVIVDTSKMSAADVAALRAEVGRRGLTAQVIFHP